MQPKPLRPVIARNHSLARGLVGAWPMWSSGAGGTESNLVSPGRYDLTPINGAVEKTITSSGKAFAYRNAIPRYHSIDTGLPVSPMSAYVRFRYQGASSSYGTVFGRFGGLGYCWHIETAGAGNGLALPGYIYGAINHGATSGYHYYIHPAPLVVGQEYSAVLAWYYEPSSAHTDLAAFWLNGQKTTDFGHTNVGVAPSIATLLTVGRRGDALYGADVDVSDARLWNRALSDTEVQDLCIDPWALYRPLRIRAGATLDSAATHPYYYRNFVSRAG